LVSYLVSKEVNLLDLKIPVDVKCEFPVVSRCDDNKHVSVCLNNNIITQINL